jgi:hypothetical protein
MIWLIITIIICTAIIVGVIKDQSPEEQNKRILKEIKAKEEWIQYFRDMVMSKGLGTQTEESLDEFKTDIIKMENNYNLLKEKENNLHKVLELRTDLNNYILAVNHMRHTWEAFGADFEPGSITRFGEKMNEDEPVKKAIEDKFNRLLGI